MINCILEKWNLYAEINVINCHSHEWQLSRVISACQLLSVTVNVGELVSVALTSNIKLPLAVFTN